MTNAGKTVLQVPQVNSVYNASDRLVIVYGANTANQIGSVAQTATITTDHFFQTTTPYIPVQQSDPANSSSATVTQGQIFASNTFLYIAIANNVLRRVAIADF